MRTSIQMFNGMTPGLRSMTNALNITISSFEAMQRASSNSIDTSSLQAARAELNRAEVAFNQIETSMSQADQQQQRLNDDMRSGAGIANGLRGMLAGIGGLMGVKKIVDISDEFSRSTARLSLMAGGMENVKGIQEDIYQSTQRTRTSYLGTMDAVAKLGLRAGAVFKNSGETIAFVEQLNKQFKIAGASQQEISSATLQLTQALGSGVLRGEEFNAVFEAAPNVMQSVADYMNVPIGKLRNMASEGEITADIIKNAMFASADETNEKFKQIPNTWADVWTMTVNKVIMMSQPLLKVIGVLANNWSIIEPLILGVATAFAVYAIAAHGAEFSLKAVKIAQAGLNAVMALNPIVLVILAVIALIAIFYSVIAAINKVKGTTISATGVITGGINVAIQFVKNLGLVVANIALGIGGAMEAVGNNIETAFHNAISHVKGWWFGLLSTTLTVIDSICAKLNELPFVSFDYSGVSNAASEYAEKSAKAFGDVREYENIREAFDSGISTYDTFQDGWEKNAYDTGYNFGKGIDDKVKGLFGGDGFSMPDFPTTDTTGLEGDVSQIADNTGGISDSLNISKEDLKYMRDVAEREAINRYTTAQIAVDFKNTANINSNMDIDGVMNKFTEVLREAVNTSAEEVHYVV